MKILKNQLPTLLGGKTVRTINENTLASTESKEQIVNALDAVYCSTINDLKIDVMNQKIEFDLTFFEDDKKTEHKLSFLNCSSFLWTGKWKDDRNYKPVKWNYYELSEIHLVKMNVDAKDEWLSQYSLDYDVAIEIWDTALLICAKELVIDEQHFPIS